MKIQKLKLYDNKEEIMDYDDGNPSKTGQYKYTNPITAEVIVDKINEIIDYLSKDLTEK